MTNESDLLDQALAGLNVFSDRFAALRHAAASRLARLHWAWQVALIWAVTRVFTGLVVLAVAGHQGPNPWSSAQPGYLTYINGWDAGYYERIHDTGYPAVLPTDASGHVLNNGWAFMPGYPWLVKAITGTTGAAWLVVAPAVSTLACLAFLLVTYRLFRIGRAHATSLVAVTAIAVGTASPVLQFGYAESLALLLLAGLLYLLATGRYYWGAAVVLLLAFTKPLTAPVAATCLVSAGWTFWAHRRAGRRLQKNTIWSLVVLCAASLVGVAAWPAIAAVVTHQPKAYLLTEASWHGGDAQVPVVLFLKSFVTYLGFWPGLAAAAVVLVLLAAMMFSRPVRQLGAVLWAWVGSMVAYLVAIVPVNTSVIRLALPLFPLALAASLVSSSRAYRVLWIFVLAVSQVAWLAVLWHWSGTAPQPAP